jgi:hypothetical protein
MYKKLKMNLDMNVEAAPRARVLQVDGGGDQWWHFLSLLLF